MTTHTTATRKDWLAARLELLEAEKELTRRSDELARRRRQLPWVRVEKDYCFETDEGAASLADLFGGRSQLLIYHFMFGPAYSAGCPSCSAIAVDIRSPEHAGFRRALLEVYEPRYGREFEQFIDSGPVYARIDAERMFALAIASAQLPG